MRRHLLPGVVLLSFVAGCSGGGDAAPPNTADYFNEINPSLRWSGAKTANPLKVFIGLDGTTDRSVEIMGAATAWSTASSNLVRFTQTTNSAEADIKVDFSPTVNLADGGIGIARIAFSVDAANATRDGIIQSGEITFKAGTVSQLLVPTAKHEFGHLLGIIGRNPGDNGHSAWKGDIMHDSVTKDSAVSTRDSATLLKLYALSRHR